jgi:glucosamine--fructose-6-phosphate aminotransferase (isomerizing)
MLTYLPYAIAASLAIALGIQQADNCGIIGVVGGQNEEAKTYLLEGLTIMRNRGYDSAGIATIDEEGHKIAVTKFASRETTGDSIDLVAAHSSAHDGNIVGIAHTRWATHGGKTDANAHPHMDQKHRVAVVHNGTINNSFELKKELTAMGVHFTSETDTEVIAQLIGLGLDKGLSTKDAVAEALER